MAATFLKHPVGPHTVKLICPTRIVRRRQVTVQYMNEKKLLSHSRSFKVIKWH